MTAINQRLPSLDLENLSNQSTASLYFCVAYLNGPLIHSLNGNKHPGLDDKIAHIPFYTGDVDTV